MIHRRPDRDGYPDETTASAAMGMFWGMLFGVLFFVPFFGVAVGAGPGR